MSSDNTLDERGPGVNVRAAVVHRCIEANPLVRMFRRYQRDCIDLAREQYPDLTGPMSDADVWAFTKAR